MKADREVVEKKKDFERSERLYRIELAKRDELNKKLTDRKALLAFYVAKSVRIRSLWSRR